MKRLQTIIILAFLAVSFPAAGFAQETSTEGTAETAVPKIKFLPPAYGPKLLRMSEILGGLHYLRQLCGADEGPLWRKQMQTLINAEEPDAKQRAEMIAHFNRGFRGYRETYRECTDAALEANSRYVREGIQIASDITNRYGR